MGSSSSVVFPSLSPKALYFPTTSAHTKQYSFSLKPSIISTSSSLVFSSRRVVSTSVSRNVEVSSNSKQGKVSTSTTITEEVNFFLDLIKLLMDKSTATGSKKSLVISPLFMAALVGLIALSPLCYPSISYGEISSNGPQRSGASLFHKACIGCHYGGGNIVQPGSTLFLKDLQRNGVDSEEEIYKITYYGKGRMPGFGEKCTPRGQCTFGERLQDEDIQLLAEYIKQQSALDWVAK